MRNILPHRPPWKNESAVVNLDSAEAVSYTHLDVDKRQE